MGAGKTVGKGIEVVETFLKELNKPAKAAPQDEALKLAQQRAALPPSQGGLGLPANNTPEQRARAMEFDLDKNYVHNTSLPFDKVKEDGRFSGIFALPNYSANYGNVDMPLVARGKIASSSDLRGSIKNPSKQKKRAIDEEIPSNIKDPADIADAYVKMQRRRNELARELGYTGVKINDEFGDTISLVSPENIRSRFAAFDPFRRDAATAALLGVAAPDLLAQEQEKAAGEEVQIGSNKKMPNDESAFQNWIRGTDWFKEFKAEYNEEPDLDTKDYDYRAAWKAGVQPERDPYDNNRFHWPSSLPTGEMLKSADHPTAWKEYFMRETGVNPDALGLKTPEDASIFIENISKRQEKAAGGEVSKGRAASIGGEKFYNAALAAGLPLDNDTLNKIVDLVNAGHSVSKAAQLVKGGSEVHMADGGGTMLAELMERYNTPRNKSRYSAGIFDSKAPGEVRSVTPTVKERMASGLQAAMEAAGSDRYKARQRAQTIVGGENSRLPGGFGVLDIGAMVNPVVAAGMMPLYGEEAIHNLANVPNALKRGDIIGAGVEAGFGLMDLIPAVGQGKRVAKGVARGIKDAVTSDAGYDLAQRVLNATGTAPAQIMMGPTSKTWNHSNAALAKHMELQGENPEAIWKATGTFRGPDDLWRQEIPDVNMKYSVSPVRSRQYETDRKRYSQAIDKATTQEELQAAQKYYEKQRGKNSLNFIGKAQEFIEHPELFQAYPELANYAFRELEPTHKKFTAPQTAYGFYSPGQKTITVNTDAPLRRSTALHELQHAIQEIEGWQGGSSPQEMAAKLADREIAKTREADLLQSIQEMQKTLPPSANNLILTEGQKLKNIQDFLKQTRRLEGERDPYNAYRRVSGEEEARMVQARQPYSEEKLTERPPFEDYETDPSYHITEFADGGEVHMAGGKDVTKEAIKQGVKKSISAIDEFLSSLKPGETPATAADRAAAGRAGAALIKATPQVKASEALGQAMEQGFNKTTTTQSDRTRVGGGNIGGASFSAISEADPRYAGKVWGVMDQGTASRLANLTSPETAWSTMLGSATQLKTNPVVFSKLEKQFKKGLKEGRLQPELEDKINQNLGLFLGEGANIRDPEIWKMLDTFEKRASMADVMMGKGLPPKKGGVALGGEKSGKGVIFNPTEILIEETERGLLHPEHGGYVPTFAVGPRLFSLTGESSFRPDLHPGFPTLLEGKDLGVNMMATPTEVYLPDWHSRFKANNPDRQDPGYYDLALGVKGEGLPSQDLTDEYIRHLIREGYAEGGEVDSDSVTLDDFLSKQGY